MNIRTYSYWGNGTNTNTNTNTIQGPFYSNIRAHHCSCQMSCPRFHNFNILVGCHKLFLNKVVDWVGLQIGGTHLGDVQGRCTLYRGDVQGLL